MASALSSVRSLPSLLAGIAATAAWLPAQCGLSALPLGGAPGFAIASSGSSASAITEWDPDGVGPLGPQLVFGGDFQVAGYVAASNLAAFDPSNGNWVAFGAGTDGPVRALATRPNGDLVIAGRFSAVNGVAAQGVAVLRQGAWSALGPGLQGTVRALAVLPNGDIVAGGSFASAGTTPVNCIARWDGTAWQSLPGLVAAEVLSLAVSPNGDLFAGGRFGASSTGMDSIARWDGTAWSALRWGLDGPVEALVVTPSGDLIAGGSFSYSRSGALAVFTGHVARWSGGIWIPVATGSGPDRAVQALAVLGNGDIVAGGSYTAIDGLPRAHVAVFDGARWSDLDGGVDGDVLGLHVTTAGALVVTGRFQSVGPSALGVSGAAIHDGVAWSRLGTGTDAPVRAIAPLAAGGVVMGGDFRVVGGVDAAHVVIRRDGVFQPLGAGIRSAVGALCELPGGDIVAVGSVPSPVPVPPSCFHRWDGVAWSQWGATFDGTVRDLLATPDGSVLAVGGFGVAGGPRNVARFDGANWSGLGTPPNRVQWNCGVVTDAGEVVCGGLNGPPFTDPVIRFDGSQWQPVGSGLSGVVNCLIAQPNGRLVAGGGFLPSGQIAVFDGVAWTVVVNGPDGMVTDLLQLPNGDLIAAGSFETVAGQPAGRLARSDAQGLVWAPLGAGVNDRLALYVDAPTVLAMATDGTIAVGGSFQRVALGASAYYTEVLGTCPADASSYGVGCAGAAGPVTLQVESPALIGAVFGARGRGFAPSSFALALLGAAATASPLDTLHPAALPGCTLLTLPDLATALLAPVAGSVRYLLPIPPTAQLIGAAARVQLLQVEVGAGGSIAQITASNGLSLRVGAL